MRLTHIDGPGLRGALIAACDYVQLQRAELNRINIFPVPDGDTGTNFALTARSIADRLRSGTDDHLGAVAREAAEAGILGARGNSGMILSHYLLGLAESIGDRVRMSVTEFAESLRAASDHVYRALEDPIEGTIVTVMRETAEEAESRSFASFQTLFRRILCRAYATLARTPELLPVLRKAGVVDAGAKGFVHLLEGIVAYLSGDPIVALEEEAPGEESLPIAAAAAEYPTESERYRYCTEALVRGAELPEADEVRTVLRTYGDSLVVIRSGDLLKVHIHTDLPDQLFAYLRTLGELEAQKAEDMGAQHATLRRAAARHLELARRPVAVVTDTACDLPEPIVRAHGIHLVPLTLIFEDGALYDRVEISAEEFSRRLLAGEHPTTSQPTPAAFLEAYEDAAEEGEAVIAITIAGVLSGTLNSAEAAARHLESEVQLIDSRGATLLQGLLALRAAELGELGLGPKEIVEEIGRVRERSGLLITVDVFENLLASGRVGRGRALLGSLLDIKPILELDSEGRVQPLDRVRGRRQILPRILEILEERVPPGSGRIRFGVAHVACEEVLDEVSTALRGRYGQETEIVVGAASPVLATHVGPGAWAVAYMVE